MPESRVTAGSPGRSGSYTWYGFGVDVPATRLAPYATYWLKSQPVAAQTARDQLRRRNRNDFRRSYLLANTLIIAEEEDLVLDDRTADRSAKLVLQSRGNWTRAGLREWIARQIRRALAVIKRRAMELVRTRLRRDRIHRGDRLAKLGIVVLRRNLRIRHRVRVRIDDDDSQNRVLVIRAVQRVVHSTKRLSIDLDLLWNPAGFHPPHAPIPTAPRPAATAAGSQNYDRESADVSISCAE